MNLVCANIPRVAVNIMNRLHLLSLVPFLPLTPRDGLRHDAIIAVCVHLSTTTTTASGCCLTSRAPSFTEKLGVLLPERDALYHHLVRYFFHPSDHMSWYYQAYLMRTGQPAPLPYHVVHFQEKLLPEVFSDKEPRLSCRLPTSYPRPS